MSDLTKTCAVIVAPVVLAALAVEGCRHAAKRLAQHAAEAERRRRQRLERRGQELRAELAREIAQVDTFARSVVGQHVKSELQSTRNSLAKLGEESLEDEVGIAAVGKRLKRLRKSLADAVARAETIQHAAEIGQVQAALLQLNREVAAGRLLSRQFDLDGLHEVDAQVKVVESLLQRQKLAQAEQEMALLQESFARHHAQVEAGQDRWIGLHEEAATAAAIVNERLVCLQADEVIRRWHGSDLEALVRRAGQLEGSVSAGRFAQVHF